MSDKGSSRFSRFKKRVSSIFSPSPPASSRQKFALPDDNTGRLLETPSLNDADTHLAPPPLSHCPSISTVSAHSTANSIPAHPSPSPQRPIHQLEDSAYRSYSSAHLATPSLPQPPQSSAFQGPSHTFGGAHNFVMNNPMFNDYNANADNFMEKLLQETIIGAEFDSSARDPPPRCHPGTRLAIIQRCLDFVLQCHGEGKLRWVVGQAGVGKSAVMQMVTEKAPDGVIFASIFLSINGRRDGTKVILTIAYQLAVKCPSYRQFVRGQIALDPSLLRKSLSVQFRRFIVEPFMLERLFEPFSRVLMVIDGLDECDSVLVQQNLLELITDFCITYPTSPIAWIVASRPEPHITSFFDQAEVKPAHIREQIEVDSDEACEDVQRYLRDELKKIQLKYPTLRHKRVWPLEHEFTKIASSAGGLFAYAATVVRYIGNPHYQDPAAQLRRVLETIDASAKDHISGRDHPMAQLDALYKRILSNIPDDVKINARKLLLPYSRYGWSNVRFRELCNILGLTEGDAYGAICHLHAVMKIPEPDKADDESLSYYHKSFEDFLFDSKRSGLSDNFRNEDVQLRSQASLRIIGEVPYDSDCVVSGKDISLDVGGRVKGCCNNISLSWPCDERLRMTDEKLRTNMYGGTMGWICVNFAPNDSPYGSISWFHALTTRFTVLGSCFPFYRLRDSAFDKFRQELTELGKLKQVTLRALDYAAICGDIELRFMSPIGIDVEISDPWDSSCEHGKKEISGLQQRRGWKTQFRRYYQAEDANIPRFHITTCQPPHKNCFDRDSAARCNHCSRRFAQHFMNNPDQLATVFVDGIQLCYVEFSLVDPEDGVSEWRYRFCHSGPPTCIDA